MAHIVIIKRRYVLALPTYEEFKLVFQNAFILILKKMFNKYMNVCMCVCVYMFMCVSKMSIF